jgi:hypothetical protein
MIPNLDKSEYVDHADLSQRETVLKHLQKVGPLTPLEARVWYGIGRLAARVHKLRQEGYPIKTEQDGPSDFATYRYKG